MDWLHRLLRGHRPVWAVAGYDGLELIWACRLCEPLRDFLEDH